jgi:hypothetical protein
MMLRTAFLALPLTVFAQTPPAEVDQALRARVSEFFQYHVDGNFIKAFNLVADESKDYYFSAQKNKLQTYKIDAIEYSDNFTKAEVQLTGQRMFRLSAQFPEALMTVPMKSTWKIENDKWMYFHDPASDHIMLPMIGASNRPAESGGVTPPANLSQGAIEAAARKILQQSSIDKSQVILAADKPSSDQVIFHNGYEGWVQLGLDSVKKVPGFTAELDKTSVNAGEDAVLKLRYEPTGEDRPGSLTVQLTVLPFNQSFPVSVNFVKP